MGGNSHYLTYSLRDEEMDPATDYYLYITFSQNFPDTQIQHVTVIGETNSVMKIGCDDVGYTTLTDEVRDVQLPVDNGDGYQYEFDITPAEDESFVILKDGVDVTREFEYSSGNNLSYYNFDITGHSRKASNWHVIVNKVNTQSSQSSASKRWNISRTLGGGSVTCGWTDGSQVIEGVNTTIDLSAETDKVTLFIAPEDGKTLTVYRDNQDVTSLFTCNSGTDEGTPYVNYTLEVPAQDIATAQWNISFASEGGDVNGDGKVNVSDIDKLIEKINE